MTQGRLNYLMIWTDNLDLENFCRRYPCTNIFFKFQWKSEIKSREKVQPHCGRGGGALGAWGAWEGGQ